jgi:hypothetical protein
MPNFRKFDPKRFNPSTGRLLTSKTKNLAQKAMPAVIPFSKVIVAAFMVHQIYSIVRRWIKGRRERGLEPQVLEEEEPVNDQAYGSSNHGNSSRPVQSAMTQAMIRNALPRPKSVPMSKRLSDAHHLRHSSSLSTKKDKSQGYTGKQQVQTSKSMMGGPKVGAGAPGGLRMREVGVLGRMEAEAKAAKTQPPAVKK